jgi:hypothetical protein
MKMTILKRIVVVAVSCSALLGCSPEKEETVQTIPALKETEMLQTKMDSLGESAFECGVASGVLYIMENPNAQTNMALVESNCWQDFINSRNRKAP